MMQRFLFRRPAVLRILPLNMLAAIAFFLIFQINARAQEPAQKSGALAPLPLALPPPTLKGTPQNLPTDTTALPPTDKSPAPFYAPKGVKNIALGKPVTGSNPSPINGELQQITDGKKQALNENEVTLRRGLQWVQIDLQGEYNLYAIVLWHDFTTAVVYRDVIVQVSDDPEFETGVHTLFNNDQSNRSGLGAGTDREYFENPLTGEGKLVDAKGIKARYLRCYSHGSTDNALNTYIEVEAYGLPAS
jgi:hypothetical protein